MNQTATLKWYNTVTLRLTRFDRCVVRIKDTEAVAEGKSVTCLLIRPGKWQYQVLDHCIHIYMFLLPFIHECLML